jgi:D-alanyl-lipoteichoic acid acyltransferase DltB (MBOAT superfamily)
MLFNSVQFLVDFAPLIFIGTFVLARSDNRSIVITFLIIASLVFYGWNRPLDLLVLVPSVAINFFIGIGLGVLAKRQSTRLAWLLLAVGVGADLGLIGYFKYLDFLRNTVVSPAAGTAGLRAEVLPLGISFFTFQQIKFLVDRYRGNTTQPRFLDYCLFVVFFPHVIAGPIVHHDVLIPQFREHKVGRARLDNFIDGLVFFLLGLAKKVVLADQFGAYADGGFSAVAHGHTVTTYAAWAAVLSYTLQIYFDFSGYSDMAYGLARAIGLNFPMNFDSPYRATSVIDFWRRWHITLSQFLRDHLYIPLGGNRHGKVRRYFNLMATMVIGGLWHGAGWTFLFWGGLHGLYLMINHGWNALLRSLGIERLARPIRLLGWFVTLFAVIVAWVFFRARTFHGAAMMLSGMAGANGAELPSQIIAFVPPLRWIARGVGEVQYLGDGTVMGLVELSLMLAIGFGIAALTPNLYRTTANRRLLLLVPSFAFTVQKVFFSGAASSFIYFRF